MSKKSCSIEGCDLKYQGRGYCNAHYQRWRRHGDPLKGIVHLANCTLDGCTKPHYGHGLCSKHYTRLRNHGNPNVTVNFNAGKYGFDTQNKEHAKTNPVAFLYFSYQRALKRVRGVLRPSEVAYYEFDPIMPIQEWLEAYVEDKKFLCCYSDWQLSGHQLKMLPVPDHDTGNGLGYTLTNIEWVPFYVNSQRAANLGHERRAI